MLQLHKYRIYLFQSPRACCDYTVVNRQTHRDKHKQLLAGYTISSANETVSVHTCNSGKRPSGKFFVYTDFVVNALDLVFDFVRP